jgi:hypothetical protein
MLSSIASKPPSRQPSYLLTSPSGNSSRTHTPSLTQIVNSHRVAHSPVFFFARQDSQFPDHIGQFSTTLDRYIKAYIQVVARYASLEMSRQFSMPEGVLDCSQSYAFSTPTLVCITADLAVPHLPTDFLACCYPTVPAHRPLRSSIPCPVTYPVCRRLFTSPPDVQSCI